jgi:tRNA pseudouridine38-40 synthase
LPNESPAPLSRRGRRLKLIVAYDGSGFSGWQSQARGDTIQDRIEAAFASVLRQKVRVHGAGRTDAGVHALGQCAHVDLPPTRLKPAVLASAVNASLPLQIRVLRCRFVARTFHARFSSRGKVYRYRLATTPVLSPFELGRAWHVTGALDDRALHECAQLFAGTHDFSGFAANRGHPVTSTTRTILRVRLQRTAATTAIEFEGDGFLYKMVRLMVGSMVQCALGKKSLGDVQERLLGGNAERGRLVAPALGLTLVRVTY